jgi:adenosylhomocysteinase
MSTRPAKKIAPDYAVKDIGLAEWGRKELAIAETEMPGLMAMRKEYGPTQPLKGARIAGSLHMTIQTACSSRRSWSSAPRCAGRRATSSRRRITPLGDRQRGIPVFAYKGESLEEYWDYTHRILEWHDGGTPNMILDDGGDATLLVTLGSRAEKDPSLVASPTNEEEEALYAAIVRA